MARAYFRFRTGRQGAKKVAPDNGTWWLDFRDESGRRKYERCPALKRDEAERLLHEREAKAYRVRRGLAVEGPPPITWAETTRLYRAAKKHMSSFPSVDAQLRLHLDPLFGRRLLADITPADVEALETRFSDSHAPGSIRALQVRVSAVYTWAAKKGRIYRGENPAASADKVAPQEAHPVALTTEQVERMLDSAEELRFLFLFAVLTGLRRGELAGLRWDCLDLARGLMHVRYSYERQRTKGGRERPLPLHPQLLPVLRDMQARARSRWVFPTREGHMRTDNWDAAGSVRAALRRAGLVSGYLLKCRRSTCAQEPVNSPVLASPPCPACGFRLWPVGQPLEGVTLKSLRSTFGTWLAETAGTRVAQLFLGHSSLHTTEAHYTAVRAEGLRPALEGLALGAQRRDKAGTSVADSHAAPAAAGQKGA